MGNNFFTGQATNKIDAKGRVSVPASFRALLQMRGLVGVALYRNPDFPCLEGTGMDHIEKLADSLPDDPSLSAEAEETAHLIIGSVREALFDGGGRVVLPDDFLKYANLSDEALFVGIGRSFQIWEPAAYHKTDAELNARRQARRRGLREGGAS